MVVTTFALMRWPESTARKVSTWAGALGLIGFLAFYFALPVVTKPAALGWVLSVLWPNMNTLVFLPIFGILTAWMGTRRPYSSYEYLLNECYQCGKCHTVCPVTKVEDDALGGLNLVYNTFKKQHDGVPLWTCLACDACSAVCPLDIQYSDYILEERAKVHARMAADGGGKECWRPSTAPAGRSRTRSCSASSTARPRTPRSRRSGSSTSLSSHTTPGASTTTTSRCSSRT